MAKLIIDGVEIRAVSLNTAPNRAVIALQRETGMTLKEIVAQAQLPTEQAWAQAVTTFLSEHNRGRFVSLDEVLDRPMSQYVPDADDLRRKAEEEGTGEVPTPAGTDIPAPDTTAAPAPAPATPRSRASTRPSRGSTARSAPVASES